MIDYAPSLCTESMLITKVRRNDLKLEQPVVFGKARGFVFPVEHQTNWIWLIVRSRGVIEVRDGLQHVCSSINEFVKVLLEMVSQFATIQTISLRARHRSWGIIGRWKRT